MLILALLSLALLSLMQMSGSHPMKVLAESVEISFFCIEYSCHQMIAAKSGCKCRLKTRFIEPAKGKMDQNETNLMVYLI